MNKIINTKIMLLAKAILISYSLIVMFGQKVNEFFPFAVIVLYFLLLYVKPLHETTNRKKALLLLLFCGYCSFCCFYGYILYSDITLKIYQNIIILISGTLLFYELTSIIYNKVVTNDFLARKHLFIHVKSVYLGTLCFVLNLVCWLPCLLENYPAILISDSTWQWSQALGESALSNHHPIIHTFFIMLCQKLSTLFAGGYNPATACLIYSIIQSVILSSVFSFVTVSVYKMNIDHFLLILIILFYAFFPMNAIFSIYMTKDVLFSAYILLLSVEIYKIIQTDFEWLKHYFNLSIFVIILILIMISRSNGFVIAFGTVIILGIVGGKANIMKSVVILMLMVISYLSYGKILNCMNVEEPNIAESLGVPINQISLVVCSDENKLTSEEKSMIEKVLSIDEIKQSYNKYYSDPVKFNKNFNSNAIHSNYKKYIQLYIRLFFKYPKEYLKANLYLTIGYWYPCVNKGCVSYNVEQKNSFLQDIGVNSESNSNLYDKYIGTDVRYSIIESWMWSIGLAVMIMIFCCILLIGQSNCKYLMVILPNILLWLTLLLSAPSYCETRYVYSIFITIPLYVSLIAANTHQD